MRTAHNKWSTICCTTFSFDLFFSFLYVFTVDAFDYYLCNHLTLVGPIRWTNRCYLLTMKVVSDLKRNNIQKVHSPIVVSFSLHLHLFCCIMSQQPSAIRLILVVWLLSCGFSRIQSNPDVNIHPWPRFCAINLWNESLARVFRLNGFSVRTEPNW